MRKTKKKDSNQLNSLYLVFDTETTGLIAGVHSVIQIAGVVFRNGVEKQRFNFLCQPKRWDNIEPEALDVNGRTLEELKEAMPYERCVQKVIDILESYASEGEKIQLVAHNMPFDYRMTKALFDSAAQGDKFDELVLPQDECICTKKWGNRANKRLGWGLEDGKLITFALHFDFRFDAHDALGDTLACIGLLVKLLENEVLVAWKEVVEGEDEGEEDFEQVVGENEPLGSIEL